MPSFNIKFVKDIFTLSLSAMRIVLQVLIQVTTITMASDTIMQDLVTTDTTIDVFNLERCLEIGEPTSRKDSMSDDHV